MKAGSEINQKHNPKKQIRSHLLSNANDWKFLTDLPGTNYVFPPEVYSTPERPDILIWSPKLRTILMLELTCPAEEGIQAAKLRKQSKYMPLLNNISSGTAWKPILLTLEVGARGFVATSTRQVFINLGIQRQAVSELCKKLSTAAAKCSYTIYLASNSKAWDHTRQLLDEF